VAVLQLTQWDAATTGDVKAVTAIAQIVTDHTDGTKGIRWQASLACHTGPRSGYAFLGSRTLTAPGQTEQ
jgi:hypothetical protein